MLHETCVQSFMFKRASLLPAAAAPPSPRHQLKFILKRDANSNYDAHNCSMGLIVPTMSSSALIIDYELFTMSLPLIMQNFKAVIPHLRLYFHYLPEGI